mgnify:CR=1 FL=1
MNLKKKIIYLLDQALDDFNIERFFIDEIEKKGWIIEVWDFTKIYHKKYHENYYKDREILNDKRLKIINTFDDFKNNVHKNKKNTVYFDHLSRGEHYFVYRLRNYLKKNKKIRVVFASGNFPIPSKKIKILNILQNNNIKNLIYKIIKRLTIKYFKYCDRPDIYFSGGYLSKKSYLAKSTKNLIEAHNFDYDRFLEFKNNKHNQLKKNLATFIDQDMCFHLDQYVRLSKPHATPDEYYPSINKFFNFLLQSKKINTQISLHPRSNPNRNYTKYFRKNKISEFSNLENIFQSDLIIAHYSTSIQLAVLLYKPIIFITTDQIEKTEISGYIEHFANTLGKKSININHDLKNINWKNEFKVNKKKYEEYIYNYVKVNTESIHSLPELCNTVLNKIINLE